MVNINLNIQKKDLWLLTAIMVFLVGVTFVIAYSQPIPNPGHGGDNVFIYINGNSKDLQQAIDDGEFNSAFTGGSYSGTIISGHKGEEIIVNVDGNIKSFQEAINDGSLSSTGQGTSPSNFGSIVHGNNGDEIWININSQEKTLQQAINDGDFIYVPTAHVSIVIWKIIDFRTWYIVYTTTTIRQDSSSGPIISGAIVGATWSGSYRESVSGTTNSNGQVFFETGWVITGSNVGFTVDSVTVSGVSYNLAGTTTAWINI